MKYIFLILSILFISKLSAQTTDPDQVKDRVYQSIDYLKFLKQEFNISESLSEYERQIENELRFEDPKDRIIPIIFHVLHLEPEERINEEQLAQQIELLNQDFAGETADTLYLGAEQGDRRNLEQYAGRKADTQIQFCLPTENPLGLPTQGVNYIPTLTAEFTDFSSMKTSETGVLGWDTKRYLNIWVCNLPEGNAGFAQMPMGPENLDGIVINYKYLQKIGEEGSLFNGGKTLTHLIGNYLGLYPLWGEGPCQDDYVADTPIHNEPNRNPSNSKHISLCSGYPTEMTNNFMDSNTDGRVSMFTKGQARRMQMALSEKGPRGELSLTNTNCSIDELMLAGDTREEELTEKPDHKFTKLSVQPNPAKDEIFISFEITEAASDNSYQINLFSLSGELLLTLVSSKEQKINSIQLDKFPSGMYLLNITCSGKSYSEKFIIQ